MNQSVTIKTSRDLYKAQCIVYLVLQCDSSDMRKLYKYLIQPLQRFFFLLVFIEYTSINTYLYFHV